MHTHTDLLKPIEKNIVIKVMNAVSLSSEAITASRTLQEIEIIMCLCVCVWGWGWCMKA